MSAQRSAVVLVVSTSAAAGDAADRTGPVIVEWLADRGFQTGDPIIVGDGEPAAAALAGSLLGAPHAILTTGGTGVSPTDRTPEIVDPLLDVRVPGLIEELRRRGAEQLPAALLTRGVAGFSGQTFIMTLPGSPGGVRDGLAVLDPLLEHLMQQRAGSASGHPPR